MTHSEQINELAAALAKAQGQIKAAKKDKTNPFFKSDYADLISVIDACREPLATNGLAVIQTPSMAEGGRVMVETMLVHASGQWVKDSLAAFPKDDGPQAMGSVITYLRRYSLAAVAGVAPDDDDDDGEAAHGRAAEGYAPAAKTVQADRAERDAETHAERIARVKAEAAAKRTATPVEKSEATPAAPKSHGEREIVEEAPVEPGVEELYQAPTKPKAPPPEAPPDGSVYITGINVRNGPMVIKDGKSQPSWGPLYIIAFNQKVKASDGTMVLDASTFTQEDAAKAEQARDEGTALKPVVEPGTKKGSYKLIRFA